MKKMMAFILAALLLFSLSASGQGKTEAKSVGGWTLTDDGAVTKESGCLR